MDKKIKYIIQIAVVLALIWPFYSYYFANKNSDQDQLENTSKIVNVDSKEVIEKFILEANLPFPRGEINYLDIDEINNVILFNQVFGSGMDCPSGCIYSTIVGVYHKGKVGFVGGHSLFGTGKLIPENMPYKFDDADAYLYSEEFLDHVFEKWEGSNMFYPWFLFQNIMKSENVTSTHRLDVFTYFYDNEIKRSDDGKFNSPFVKGVKYALENPAVKNEPDLLNLLEKI